MRGGVCREEPLLAVIHDADVEEDDACSEEERGRVEVLGGGKPVALEFKDDQGEGGR